MKKSLLLSLCLLLFVSCDSSLTSQGICQDIQKDIDGVEGDYVARIFDEIAKFKISKAEGEGNYIISADEDMMLTTCEINGQYFADGNAVNSEDFELYRINFVSDQTIELNTVILDKEKLEQLNIDFEKKISDFFGVEIIRVNNQNADREKILQAISEEEGIHIALKRI